MSLALQTKNGTGTVAQYQPEAMSPTAVSFDQIWEMAGYAAKSRMFGVETAEQAFCLMMLCQAKGLHPIEAVTRYHVIKGKPSMKAEVMQAEFQAHGGSIVIVERSTTRACALFSHSIHQPKPVEMSFTMEDAKAAKLISSEMYQKYPKSMLWWRLISEAVRAIMPGIISGIYTPEEIEEMDALPYPVAPSRPSLSRSDPAAIEAAPSEPDVPVMGCDPSSPDQRTYSQLVYGAVTATNDLIAKNLPEGAEKPEPLGLGYTHGRIFDLAVGKGWAEGEKPKKATEAVKVLTPVYATHRNEVRAELQVVCNEYQVEAAKKLAASKAVDPDEPENVNQDDDIDYSKVDGGATS